MGDEVDSAVADTASAYTTTEVPDYQARFGLQGVPFDASLAPYFPAHGRQPLKEQLLHLLHFSDQPSLVSGAKGSGKSALCHALAAELTDEDYCFRPSSASYASASALLYELAAHIGLAVSSSTQLPELRAKLTQWAEFSEGNLQVFILLDNAEQLSSDAGQELLRLQAATEPQCWRLLFFVDSEGEQRLQQWADIVDLAMQVFVMPEITPAFVGDYLTFRLAQVGYSGPALFNERELEQLWLDSGADLALLGQLAEQHLAAKASVPADSLVSSLPWLHIGALLTLLLVLLIAWMWAKPVPQPVAVVLPPVEQKQPEPVITTPVPAAPTASPEVVDPLRHSGGLSRRPAMDAERKPDTNQPPAQPVVKQSAPDVSQPAQPPAVQPAPDVSQPTAPAPEVAPAQVPEPLPAYSEDERWLLALSADQYLVQVLAASSRAGVEDFVRRHAELNLKVYRTERAGKAWYVVVKAAYADRAQARAAIQTLPKKIRESGPWPRPVAEVQQQIRYHASLSQ